MGAPSSARSFFPIWQGLGASPSDTVVSLFFLRVEDVLGKLAASLGTAMRFDKT